MLDLLSYVLVPLNEEASRCVSEGSWQAFDTISYSILLDKMSNTELDKSITHWMNSWLMVWAQRVTVMGLPQAGSPSSVGTPISLRCFYKLSVFRNQMHIK